MPTSISGLDDFQGDRLIHSSQFTEPAKNAKGKKAVVIGCCNSGHDIARDYYDNGYDVTMVQRSTTLVVKSETLIDVSMKGVYEENGVSFPGVIIHAAFSPLPYIQGTKKTQCGRQENRDNTDLMDSIASRRRRRHYRHVLALPGRQTPPNQCYEEDDADRWPSSPWPR